MSCMTGKNCGGNGASAKTGEDGKRISASESSGGREAVSTFIKGGRRRQKRVTRGFLNFCVDERGRKAVLKGGVRGSIRRRKVQDKNPQSKKIRGGKEKRRGGWFGKGKRRGKSKTLRGETTNGEALQREPEHKGGGT